MQRRIWQGCVVGAAAVAVLTVLLTAERGYG